MQKLVEIEAIKQPKARYHRAVDTKGWNLPEIEITSETTARGSWYLEDTVTNAGEANEYNPGWSVLIGTGIYSDEYVKIDDEWLISLTGYERIFEYREPMHVDSTLRTRWNSRTPA